MANNIPAFKVEFLNLFSTTANLDATTKTNLRDNFVAEYQNEWNDRVAKGTADTPTNRANFAVDKVIQYMQAVYQSGGEKRTIAALPAPAKLE
jgi:ABC-type branched-subunit amino acid transport system substrate-binding protein